jgi:hypothetical protein
VTYDEVESNRVTLEWPTEFLLPFEEFEASIFLNGFSFYNNIGDQNLLELDLSFNKLDVSGVKVFFGPRRTETNL